MIGPPDRAAYYACGGAVDLRGDENPPARCPKGSCGAELKKVVELDV